MKRGYATAGALVRGSLRTELAQISAMDPEFTWTETKSFLSSTFQFQGPLETVELLECWLASVSKENT